MKLRKCLSAVTAGAISISALAVAQMVSADAGVNAAAAEAFWGSDYGLAASPAIDLVYHYEEDLGGIVVTNYSGNAENVRIPDEIDGSPVLEVDFSGCMYNFKSLMLPDGVTEVTFAKYNDLLTYYNTTLKATAITDFEYYYDAELKGVVITDYLKDGDVVKIPEKVKLADANDSSKVSEYTIKKIDLTDCKKKFKTLVVPEADEIIIPNHEDVAVCIAHLKSVVSRSSSGKDVSKYNYTNIGVEKVNIPAQLESIDTGVFSGSMLRNVYIPDNHNEIGKWAFSDCYMLDSVTIGNQDSVIDDGAFRNCYMLENIDIVNIDSIGEWAFSGCTNLENITLSDDLETIGKGAFSRCIAMSSVTIPANVSFVGDYAFHGCESLMAVNVADGNSDYVSVDGVLFDAAQHKLLKFPEGSMLSDYTIPETVSSIAIGAFRDSGVSTVIFPNGLTKIGDGAFENSKIKTADLPSSLCVIEPGAFAGCPALTVTYKNNTYQNKASDDEYDMTRSFDDLYVDINTSFF